ncbi:MAG TPA: hypothetical protein VGE07_24665 [Herpetosiphonaceae bacterium]
MRILMYRVALAACAVALIGSAWLEPGLANSVRITALSVPIALLALLSRRRD